MLSTGRLMFQNDFWFVVLVFQACADAKRPEQRHLALAGEGRIAITWIAPSTSSAKLAYGASSTDLSLTATPEVQSYKCSDDGCGGSREVPYSSGFIHKAVLGSRHSPLEPGATYFYRCNPEDDTVFSFVMPHGAHLQSKPVTLAVVGDLGQTLYSKRTLAHMTLARPALVVDAGDLSYADCIQQEWDAYGKLVEPLAAAVPWMPVHGNHDMEHPRMCGRSLGKSFRAYEARYRLPFNESGSTSPHFYSFEIGGMHWLMLGSYVDWKENSEQMAWLRDDLKAIDRAKTPWLVAVVHAPWYSTNTAHQHEYGQDDMRESMEATLREYSLDAMFAGHDHAYERMHRLYDGEIDECGPAYFNVGCGGNGEGLYDDWYRHAELSQFREASYGHVRFTVHNATHVHYTWHRHPKDAPESDPAAADEFWLVKNPKCETKKQPKTGPKTGPKTTTSDLGLAEFYMPVGATFLFCALIPLACFWRIRHNRRLKWLSMSRELSMELAESAS